MLKINQKVKLQHMNTEEIIKGKVVRVENRFNDTMIIQTATYALVISEYILNNTYKLIK